MLKTINKIKVMGIALAIIAVVAICCAMFVSNGANAESASDEAVATADANRKIKAEFSEGTITGSTQGYARVDDIIEITSHETENSPNYVITFDGKTIHEGTLSPEEPYAYTVTTNCYFKFSYDELTNTITLTMTKTYSVTFKIQNTRGVPLIYDVYSSITLEDGRVAFGEATGSDGSYVIHDLQIGSKGLLRIDKFGYEVYIHDNFEIRGDIDLGTIIFQDDHFNIVGNPGAVNPDFKKVDVFYKEFGTDYENYKLYASGNVESDGSFEINHLNKTDIVDGKSLYVHVSSDYASPTEAIYLNKGLFDEAGKTITLNKLEAKPYDQTINCDVDGNTFNVSRTQASGRELTFLPSRMYGFRNDYLEEFDEVIYKVDGDALYFKLSKKGEEMYTYKIISNLADSGLVWQIDGQKIASGTENAFDFSSNHSFDYVEPTPDPVPTPIESETATGATSDYTIVTLIGLITIAVAGLFVVSRRLHRD